MTRNTETRTVNWVLRCAAVTILLVAGLPSTAGAGNYAGASGVTGCSGGNKTDNRDQYYWYDSLASNVQNQQDWTRTNNYNPTNINTHNDTSENAQTDAIVRDQDYTTYCGFTWHSPGSPGVVGLTSCNSLNGANECESHTIRYDNSWFDVASLDNRRGVACHETGHSVGLLHAGATASGCMKDSVPQDAFLRQHEIDVINNNYG